MATKETGKETPEVKAEVKEPEAEPTEAKTPTPEEQLEVLQARVVEAEAKADEKDKGFKSLQEKLSERNGVIDRLQTETGDYQTLSEQIQILGGAVAEVMGREETNLQELPPEKKVDLSQKFRAIEGRAQARRIGEQYRQRATATGLPEADPRIENIRLLVNLGDFRGADENLKAVEAEAKPPAEAKETPKGEKPEETEEERIDRKAEEKKKAWMVEKGYTTPEGGEPSATAPKGFAKIEQDYADGTISYKEYAKARREQGI